MNIQLDCACFSHIGRVRASHEDNFLFAKKTLEIENRGLKKPTVIRCSPSAGDCCFAVFDGMGGEDYGEVASFVAAQEMKNAMGRLSEYIIPAKRFLEDCCIAMNKTVFDKAQELGTMHMGTTVAALFVTEEEIYSCNLGDSKTFRLRNGEFMQLSCDHTDSKYLKEAGIWRKPLLTQYLGIDPEECRIEPYIAKGRLLRKDRYLICSDGLVDMVSNLEICSILANAESAEKSAAQLIQKALENGGRDNVTVIILNVQ